METTHYQTIFDFIKSQEAAYKLPVEVNSKKWGMQSHITRSSLYRDSDIEGTKTDFTPIKNITRPILNLQYRTEDIDVKDVQLYVDDKDKYHLSFLVKKYHDDVFVQEYDLDTYFDELNQSRIDFGGGLSKDLGTGCPETVPLQSIAFCDQTDLLSGPIGIKHFYSPDQLLDMADKGWGDESKGATATLEEVIMLSREEKKDDKQGTISQTPGRYIEVYEVHGNLPKKFTNKYDDSGKYETRLFIVAFYQPKSGQEREGIILYTAPETKSPFKLIKRDPVFGRALGFGGAEELFEAQMWVNYDMIRMQDMLDSASKTVLTSSDPTFTQKNKTLNLENLSVLDLAPGTEVKQIDTFPRNITLFDNSVAQWEAHAQQLGAANDSIMGQSPSAGTPFKLQELVTQESHGLHDYRRGKYAKHLEDIYKDWIIPHIQKKICEGITFLSELSLEELQYVTDALVTNQANSMIKEKILNGELVDPQEVEQFKQTTAEAFKKKGNKHFIEILKGEFKGAPLAVKVNIAGKQKNLALRVDKLTNIFRAVAATPQVLENPSMAGLFNQILEASGLEPVDFSNFKAPPAPVAPDQQPPQAQPSPLQLQPANGQ